MKREMVKSKQLQHRLNFTLGGEGMSLTMEAFVGGKVELGWAVFLFFFSFILGGVCLHFTITSLNIGSCVYLIYDPTNAYTYINKTTVLTVHNL